MIPRDVLDDADRWALAALAAANVGIGLLLVGTDGLGPVSTALRDVVGYLLVAQALFLAVQGSQGRLYRLGEELLLVNVGFLGYAAYQVLITGQERPVLATIGDAILILSTWVALILFWAHLSGRRIGRDRRNATMKSETPAP